MKNSSNTGRLYSGAEMWDPADAPSGLDHLSSSVLSEAHPVTVDKAHVHSSDWLVELAKLGVEYEDIPFSKYRMQDYDRPTRRWDNSDLLKGKRSLYGDDPSIALRVSNMVRSIVNDMIALYKDSEVEITHTNGVENEVDPAVVWANMEMEDLPKICWQQWKPPGWFLQSPVTDAVVPQSLSDEAMYALDFVIRQYAEVLSTTGLLEEAGPTLAGMDSDPNDTMTGSPLFKSGQDTHAARVLTLKAMPAYWKGDPAAWVARVENLGSRAGLAEGVINASVVSTRKGPTNKPLPAWKYLGPGMGFSSNGAFSGVYNRIRFVYPAPYHLNFALSPLYVQLSSARKLIPGLWHDPVSRDKYIERLRAVPGLPCTVDFSGMDTGMFQSIIVPIFQLLLKHGFNSWSCGVMLAAYPSLKILYPHPEAEAGSAMAVSGNVRPWCSGFKLTSEVDTIYGRAVVLSALHRQWPDVYDRVRSGQLIICELGDDVMLKIDRPLDFHQFSKDALDMWGAKLKVMPGDVLFLKRVTPISRGFSHDSRTVARFIQQTFFNERDYDAMKGGTPPAILRVALAARLDGLEFHPHFKMWWPRLLEVLRITKYCDGMTDDQYSELVKGHVLISDQDMMDIFEYAKRIPSYFGDLEARAQFSPSDALLLEYFQQLGISINHPEAPRVRQAYVDAATSTPSPNDVTTFIDEVRRVHSASSV